MQVSKLGSALLLGFVLSQAIRDIHLGHLFGTLGLQSLAGGIYLAPAMLLVTVLYTVVAIVAALLPATRTDQARAGPAAGETA